MILTAHGPLSCKTERLMASSGGVPFLGSSGLIQNVGNGMQRLRRIDSSKPTCHLGAGTGGHSPFSWYPRPLPGGVRYRTSRRTISTRTFYAATRHGGSEGYKAGSKYCRKGIPYRNINSASLDAYYLNLVTAMKRSVIPFNPGERLSALRREA
jgi:hypothetical protein